MSGPNHTFDIVALGNAIVDILAFVDEQFLKTYQILKGTRRVLSEREINNLYHLIPPARELSGGSGANTIAGLSSLGTKCAFLGSVHDDIFGHIFNHDLSSTGTHVPCLPKKYGASTARSIILITPDADRSMNTYLGASVALTPEDIIEEVIINGKIFFSEAYLWSPQPAQDALIKATKIAKEAGRKTALTLSDPGCIQQHRDELLPFLRANIDIIVGNQLELAYLYDTTVAEAVSLAQQDFEIVALTKSADGSILITKDKIYEIDPHPVSKIVDTTGAGDIYASGFFYGLLNGRKFEDIGRLASTTASAIITHMGSRPEQPLDAVIKGI